MHFSCLISHYFVQLFVKYNNHFSGVSRSFFGMSDNHTGGPDFLDLVSRIGSISFDSTGLHWRYFPKYLSSSRLDVFFILFYFSLHGR